MTMSLAAVFIPILFMSGILGRLFREFAVTITTAILISGVVSVTLTPMLCSRFLRVVAQPRTGFAGLMDRAFDALLRGYEWSLALRAAPPAGDARRVRRRAVRDGADVRRSCPKGFIPDQDNDSLNVNLQAAQGTSFYDMVEVRRSSVADDRRSGTRTSTRSSSAPAAAAAAHEQRRASTCS